MNLLIFNSLTHPFYIRLVIDCFFLNYGGGGVYVGGSGLCLTCRLIKDEVSVIEESDFNTFVLNSSRASCCRWRRGWSCVEVSVLMFDSTGSTCSSVGSQ